MPSLAPVAWRNLVLCLCGAVLIGACAAPTTSAPAADDLQITLIPAPEANAGEMLTVALADASGQPITDARVALEGNMNHAGMVPVTTEPVTDEADGTVDGRYQLPFAFTMWGDWIITVDVTQADGTTVSRDLEVQVSEGSVTGEAVAAHMDGMSTDMAEYEAGGLQVHAARARPAPLAGGTGVVYLSLHNGTDAPVTLIGGETPAAAQVEIHETVDDNGVMRMRPLENGVAIAPGEGLDLMPGGIHLMLVDLAAPLEVGQTLELTLHFDGAEDITLPVPVVTIEESMQGMDMQDMEEHDHGN